VNGVAAEIELVGGSISATSSGLVQFTPVSLRGAPMPVNGDFSAATALRRGSSFVTLSRP
jgi:hypothetical protein